VFNLLLVVESFGVFPCVFHVLHFGLICLKLNIIVIKCTKQIKYKTTAEAM